MDRGEMVNLKNPQAKRNLLGRLRRIEGQVRGVQDMLEEERSCSEILQQLTAIRAAVQGASLVLLREYATDCLINAEEDPRQREYLVQDLIDLLGKAP
jgi:DNA-binding FrmR family transcriptional regulator